MDNSINWGAARQPADACHVDSWSDTADHVHGADAQRTNGNGTWRRAPRRWSASSTMPDSVGHRGARHHPDGQPGRLLRQHRDLGRRRHHLPGRLRRRRLQLLGAGAGRGRGRPGRHRHRRRAALHLAERRRRASRTTSSPPARRSWCTARPVRRSSACSGRPATAARRAGDGDLHRRDVRHRRSCTSATGRRPRRTATSRRRPRRTATSRTAARSRSRCTSSPRRSRSTRRRRSRR